MPPVPPSPRLVKGGLVLLHPDGAGTPRVVAFQYNPETLTRTLQPQTSGGEGQEGRLEPLRFKGPPVETLKLDAEIDATDRLAAGDPEAYELGILPQLAALEILLYPAADELRVTHDLADRGAMQIHPVLAPLCLFIWSEKRVAPVRVTDLNVTEEAFAPNLAPIRAKVSLGLRVMSVADLGFASRGGSLYLEYQRQKERDVGKGRSPLSALGVSRIP